MSAPASLQAAMEILTPVILINKKKILFAHLLQTNALPHRQ